MRQKQAIDSGSLVNRILGNNSTKPVAGEYATVLCYTDRYAYKVISVDPDGKGCLLQDVKHPNNPPMCLRYKYNAWRVMYNDGRRTGDRISIVFGVNDPYFDPHF